MGIRCDIVNAFREFVGIQLPVAETGLVVVAGMVHGEPAVVQDEHFKAHGGGIINHAEQGLRREIEVGAFPAVQQGRIDLASAIDALFPGPAVKVPGGSAGAFRAPGVDHLRGREAGAGCERIG